MVSGWRSSGRKKHLHRQRLLLPILPVYSDVQRVPPGDRQKGRFENQDRTGSFRVAGVVSRKPAGLDVGGGIDKCRL